jgi:hypothetical protein
LKIFIELFGTCLEIVLSLIHQTNKPNDMTITSILKSAAKYNTLRYAISSIQHSIKPGKWSIILGDDQLFLVVTNREASILIKFGYELAY